jgi:hypothetical protein
MPEMLKPDSSAVIPLGP